MRSFGRIHIVNLRIMKYLLSACKCTHRPKSSQNSSQDYLAKTASAPSADRAGRRNRHDLVASPTGNPYTHIREVNRRGHSIIYFDIWEDVMDSVHGRKRQKCHGRSWDPSCTSSRNKKRIVRQTLFRSTTKKILKLFKNSSIVAKMYHCCWGILRDTRGWYQCSSSVTI